MSTVENHTTPIQATIPLDEKLQIDLPAGLISNVGVQEINNYLLSIYSPMLPDWWSWKAKISKDDVTEREEYIGTFPKRVQKFIYRNYNKDFTSDQLGAIGSLVEQHSTSKSKILVDFTNRFDWCDGDFKDNHSCFWTDRERSSARKSMEDGGILAMRFYDENNRGSGRAWVFPTYIDGVQCFILFNGYGIGLSNAANIFSNYIRVGAKHINDNDYIELDHEEKEKLTYKKISLTNNGDYGGTIYINGCGVGFIVGPKDVIEYVTDFDLEIECCDNTCCSCDSGIGPGNIYEFGDSYYCEECYHDMFSSCEECGETVENDSIIGVATRISSRGIVSEYIYVCEQCSNEYTSCENCGNLCTDDLFILVEGSDYVCHSCVEDNDRYYLCDCCDEHFNSKKTAPTESDDGYICENCADGHICDECSSYDADITEGLCVSCHDEKNT